MATAVAAFDRSDCLHTVQSEDEPVEQVARADLGRGPVLSPSGNAGAGDHRRA